MKIIFTIIILSINLSFASSVYSQNDRLSVNMKQKSVREVFANLEKSSGYRFFYNDDFNYLDNLVSVEAEKETMSQILDGIFKQTDFEYKILENKLVVVSIKEELLQAKFKVSGKVTDQDGQPMFGVTVSIKGTQKAVLTDVNGNFSMEVLDKKSILVFSFIGFVTQELKLTGESTVNITLQTSIKSLDEVVVTGYGSQSRKTVTASISKLDSKILEKVPYQNVATAMQGAISGVRVQTTSGQPGAAPRVIIRGGTSINNPNGATPLYIIDGVIRDLGDISADDIESLDVLKDAAATSIYGSRGSNGVVLVKTKSGKSGFTKVTYNYDITTSNTINDYKFVSGKEYITATRLGIKNAGRTPANEASLLAQPGSYGIGNDLTKNTQWTPQYLTPANQYKLNEGWESMPDPVDPTKTIIFKQTDFQKMVWQTGLAQNHYLSISGGTEKATFSVSAGYLMATGAIKTTNYHRLTMNLKGDIKVKDNLSFFGSMGYSSSGDNHTQALGDYVNMKYTALPQIMKYNYEDGSLATGRNASLGNPDYYFPKFDIKGDELATEKLTLTFGSHWTILPGLTFDPQASIFNQEIRTNAFTPEYIAGIATVSTRAASAGQSSYRQKQLEVLFNYKKQFSVKHNISVVAGYAYFGKDATTLDASGRGAATDNITTLNASSVPVSVSSSWSQQRILSYLYGINYDYQQKYLLTLNGRYDGASNLGATHKWGFFPGAAVGWNVSEENFWKALPTDLLHLKLRASYGVNGNLGVLGDYTAQGTYSTGAIYLGNSAIQNTVLPNADLRWEQSKTLDFGADIGLLKNRINILFDVYRRVTDNLLTNLTLPPSTGFVNILTNYGSLEGKGIELEINARILPETSAFQWETSFNFSQARNKILKLPYSGTDRNRVGGELIWDTKAGKYTWQGGLQEGGRIGDMFAYKQIGVYATDAEGAAGIQDAPTLSAFTRRGGDVKWQDTDGNGIIDARDRVFVGNPYPIWTGGFTNYLSYKNLKLAVRMDYGFGHTIYNAIVQQFNQNAIGDVSMTKEYYDKSWKQQGDITDTPRYVSFEWQQRNNLGRGNSTYYQKGDYLALRQVTLSYSIPVKIMKKLKMNSLTVNLTGNNLHYFRKANNNGVTVNNTEDGGTDLGHYSLTRDFILGVNLTF